MSGEQAGGRRTQLTQRPQMVVEDHSDARRLGRLPKRGQSSSHGAAAHNPRAGHRAEREQWCSAALEGATPSSFWHVERTDGVDGETLAHMEEYAVETEVRRNTQSVGAEAAAVGRLQWRLEDGVRRDGLAGTHTVERLLEALAAASEGLRLAAQKLAGYEAEEEARVQREEQPQKGRGGAELAGACEPAQAPAACGHSCPREETDEPAWLTEAGHMLAAGWLCAHEIDSEACLGWVDEGPATGVEGRCWVEDAAERAKAEAVKAGLRAQAAVEGVAATWGEEEVTPEKLKPLASAPGVRGELSAPPAARRCLHSDLGEWGGGATTGEFPFLLHLEARFALPGRILRELVATQLQCAVRVTQAKRMLEELRLERRLRRRAEAEVAAVVRLQRVARGVSVRHVCERARLKRRQAEARVRLTAREAEVRSGRAKPRRGAAGTVRASRGQVDSRPIKGQPRQEREAVDGRREVQPPPPHFGTTPGAAGRAFSFTGQEGAVVAPVVLGQGGAVGRCGVCGDLAGRYEATGAGEAVSAGGSGLEGPCTIRATKPIEHEVV